MTNAQALNQPRIESMSSNLSVPNLIQSMEHYITANVGENMTLEGLAQAAKVSKFALTRLFHKHYRQAPMRWLWTYRAHLAKDVIQLDLGLPLMDVLTLCGFNSPQHFSRFFRKSFQKTPSTLLRTVATEPQGPRDIIKLQQELYERFDLVAISALDRYKATFAPLHLS